MSSPEILWRETSAELFQAQVYQGDRSADLVIIGGGFTGCSAALEAAAQGANVMLLESATIGHGGSGRNVGLVNAGLWLPPDTVCATLGETAGEALNTVLADGPQLVFDLIEKHAINCEVTRAGTLHLAHAPKGMAELEKRHSQLAARGAPVTLLNAAEAHKRTGSQAFHGALHDARAGTVQPLAYARGLARAAAGAGALIYEYSPVVSAEPFGGQWVVRTERGKVYAKSMLIATNAYHQPFRAIDMPQVPAVHYFQLTTEPLGKARAADILPGGEGCWDTGMIMSSLRRDKAGRVILGGIGDDSNWHAGWARRKLAQVYPDLEGVEITHAWAGKISMTTDHLPKLLRVAPGNALAVFGYSGRGIAPGTVFGRSAAQALLSGQEDGLPLAPIDSHKERFCTAKSLFYEGGARMIHATAARW